MVYHHDIPHSLPAPDIEPRFGRRRKWIEALIAAAKCLFVIFVKTVLVFLAKTMWKAFQTRVISHNISRSHGSWISGDLARAPRGSLWHCSTTIRRRCRPIQKLAKRSCLSVRDRWVIGLMRFILTRHKCKRWTDNHLYLRNFIFISVQLIKIIGEKDADGFYWGECGGLSGYVPCNMVSWCW